MISAIRPFMKGELPISSPVSGLRSGAPGGSVSRPKTTTSAEQSAQRDSVSPRDSVGGERAAGSVGDAARRIGLVGAQARLRSSGR